MSAEISLLLAGGAAADTEKVKRGLALVHQHWARPVFTILRRLHAPSEFPAADFPDLWQQIICDLATRAHGGALRNQGSLFALVCTIAKRRTARHIQRRAVQRAVPIIDDLEDIRQGRGWCDLTATERREVLELIRAAIPSLRPKAAAVIQVFIDNFPQSISMATLRELVSAATGRDETLAAVKRALQDARQGLRSQLRLKGYDFRTGGDR